MARNNETVESNGAPVETNGETPVNRLPVVGPRTFSQSFDADTTAPAKTRLKLSTGHKITLTGDVRTNDPSELVELAGKQTAKTVKASVSIEYNEGSKATRQKEFAPLTLADMLSDHFASTM